MYRVNKQVVYDISWPLPLSVPPGYTQFSSLPSYSNCLPVCLKLSVGWGVITKILRIRNEGKTPPFRGCLIWNINNLLSNWSQLDTSTEMWDQFSFQGATCKNLVIVQHCETKAWPAIFMPLHCFALLLRNNVISWKPLTSYFSLQYFGKLF